MICKYLNLNDRITAAPKTRTQKIFAFFLLNKNFTTKSEHDI